MNFDQDWRNKGAFDAMGNFYPYKSQQDMSAAKKTAQQAPALTPAQQHAEELLGIARRAYDGLPEQAPWKAEIGRVLAKIDPPAPPTLEEALQALATILDSTSPQKDYEAAKAAQQIVDRARRAKIIPLTCASLSSPSAFRRTTHWNKPARWRKTATSPANPAYAATSANDG